MIPRGNNGMHSKTSPGTAAGANTECGGIVGKFTYDLSNPGYGDVSCNHKFTTRSLFTELGPQPYSRHAARWAFMQPYDKILSSVADNHKHHSTVVVSLKHVCPLTHGRTTVPHGQGRTPTIFALKSLTLWLFPASRPQTWAVESSPAS